MHSCNICNYFTNRSSSLKTHLLSNKHLLLSNRYNKFNGNLKIICDDCNKEYKHHSSFSRHKKGRLLASLFLFLNIRITQQF